jgi:hypothetical protein
LFIYYKIGLAKLRPEKKLKYWRALKKVFQFYILLIQKTNLKIDSSNLFIIKNKFKKIDRSNLLLIYFTIKNKFKKN